MDLEGLAEKPLSEIATLCKGTELPIFCLDDSNGDNSAKMQLLQWPKAEKKIIAL